MHFVLITLFSIRQGLFQDFSRGGGGGVQMLSNKIKGGSGASTNKLRNYIKNPKEGKLNPKGGGGGGGQTHPPEINPVRCNLVPH